MRIRLMAVGTKMPSWVAEGYAEYAQRMPAECRLELHEFELPKRGKNPDIARLMSQETQLIESAIKSNDRLVALDVLGKAWSTEQLSKQMQHWLQDGRDIALIIGGPDGIAPELLQKCEQRWSLSALTMPHPLVRIVVAESLYRAHSILINHPYHRA